MLENQTLEMQKELLLKHFDREMDYYKRLVIAREEARQAYLNCSIPETTEKNSEYDIARSRVENQYIRMEMLVDVMGMLDFISSDEKQHLSHKVLHMFAGDDNK